MTTRFYPFYPFYSFYSNKALLPGYYIFIALRPIFTFINEFPSLGKTCSLFHGPFSLLVTFTENDQEKANNFFEIYEKFCYLGIETIVLT